jgi:hypothetical protein
LHLTCSLAGGLLWLGVLAFGVVSEQIKTRLEDSAEQQNTKVALHFTRCMSMHVCNANCLHDGACVNA